MAKIKSVYICSECGYESPKWYGKCPSCGEWNTMNEEIKDTSKPASAARSHATAYMPPVHINEISTNDEVRYQTGSKELDRVMGGGTMKCVNRVYFYFEIFHKPFIFEIQQACIIAALLL